MRCGEEGFIICYTITDRRSFNKAVEYKNLITKVRASEDVPVILVSNKVDLEEAQRLASTEEGKSLANKFGYSCPQAPRGRCFSHSSQRNQEKRRGAVLQREKCPPLPSGRSS